MYELTLGEWSLASRCFFISTIRLGVSVISAEGAFLLLPFLASAKLEMWNHRACDLDAFSISSKPGTLNQEERFLRCFLYLDQTRDEESCSQSLRWVFKSRPNWKCGIGQQAVPLSSAWLKLVPKTAQTGFEHLMEPAEGLTASR